MNKLFVYGIFLGEQRRNDYAMSNPEYATVKNYVTVGEHIVAAVPVAPDHGTALSGLLVDVAPYSLGYDGVLRDTWARLDALEAGYDRIKITTTDGVEAYMYTLKGLDEEQA